MRDKKYWIERSINRELMAERSVLNYENSLESIYTSSLDAILKEIESFYQKYSEGKLPLYALSRRNLTPAEHNRFRILLNTYKELANSSPRYKPYLDKLNSLLQRKNITRLEMLEQNVRYQVENMKDKQFKGTTALIQENFIAAYYIAQFDLAQGIEATVGLGTLDKKSIDIIARNRWDGRNYSDSIWNDKDKLLRELDKIIPRSFSQGINSRQLGNMLAKELGKSRRHGQVLARTEVNYICNQADLEMYRVVGIPKYEYLATLDMRTSEMCRAMDGTVVLVSQAQVGINFPPLHPQCRSTTIPDFPDEEPSERIARNAQGDNITVPRRMTQKEYIEKYAPEEDKDRLLNFTKKFYPKN